MSDNFFLFHVQNQQKLTAHDWDHSRYQSSGYKMACSLFSIYHSIITHKGWVIIPVSYNGCATEKIRGISILIQVWFSYFPISYSMLQTGSGMGGLPMQCSDQRHRGFCLIYIFALRLVRDLRPEHNPMCLWTPHCTNTHSWPLSSIAILRSQGKFDGFGSCSNLSIPLGSHNFILWMEYTLP